MFSSVDGVNWEQRSSGTTLVLRGVTFGDNRFVAVGDSGTLLISDNGLDWSRRGLSTSNDLLGVGFGNGVYVVVGSSGKILTSADTSAWVSQASRVRTIINGVGFGNLRFVAVGSGIILYSMCEQELASVLNYKLQNTKYKQNTNYNVQNYKSIEIDPVGILSVGSRQPSLLLDLNGDEIPEAGETFLFLGKSGRAASADENNERPLDSPFKMSDNPDEIGYNDDMNSDAAALEPVNATNGCGGHGSPAYYSRTSSNTNLLTPGRTQSGTLVDTYYIYSFDNKLMAEYDQNGVCTKEYIYAGNRLLAEYKPQSGEYFYYMTDQINSTRVITNGSADVVEEGKTGFLVPPNNEKQLAEAMIKMYQKGTIPRMEAEIRLYKKRFEWSVMVEQITRFYNS